MSKTLAERVELADRLLLALPCKTIWQANHRDCAQRLKRCARRLSCKQREVLRIRGEHSAPGVAMLWASMLRQGWRALRGQSRRCTPRTGMNRVSRANIEAEG